MIHPDHIVRCPGGDLIIMPDTHRVQQFLDLGPNAADLCQIVGRVFNRLVQRDRADTLRGIIRRVELCVILVSRVCFDLGALSIIIVSKF